MVIIASVSTLGWHLPYCGEANTSLFKHSRFNLIERQIPSLCKHIPLMNVKNPLKNQVWSPKDLDVCKVMAEVPALCYLCAD